jgi:para-nitrobenzyl esterase
MVNAIKRSAAVMAMFLFGVAAAAAQPVRIDTGLLSGVPGRDPSITVYKGVPFAAPPVGELRWRAPQPHPSWQGVRKADRFGPICPTPRASKETMDEDCLFLNIWTGAASSTERRPVMVWFYGGGFIMGSGSDPLHDGEGLARKGVVLVTINYRLGALGFLATPELSKESGHNASGNYGLLDEIAALQWVQRNIAAFGGDPGRVTIFGHSAGAGSVNFLSLSPLAKGLFHQALAESQVRYPQDTELRYLSMSWRSLEIAEQAGLKYTSAQPVENLRKKPWREFLAGTDAPDIDVHTGSDARPPLFRPVVDGWVIPRNFADTFAKRAHNAVPFVTGNNLDEGGAAPETAFAMLRSSGTRSAIRIGSPNPRVTLADFVSAARFKFGPMADEFLKLYPATTDDEAARASNNAIRDNSRISTYLWAQQWSSNYVKPIYTYFWTHAPPGPEHDRRGAYHGSEINYAFNNLYATDKPWTDADRHIADLVSSYWANYAATGNPNGAGLPRWPAFDPKSLTVMELGDHFGPMPVADAPKLDFWKRFFHTQKAW